MGLSRRRFFELVASAVAPIISGIAWALDYVGGSAWRKPDDDAHRRIFARLIAEWLSNRLGQAFIVENRPGAGSTIGVAAVVSAPADGYGTTPQMTGELFKMMAGVDLLHVPYQGAAPALTDLLAGRAQVMFEAMPSLVGYIQSGKLRALGVSTATRSPVFPEIPAISEYVPGYEASVWFGIAARRQTPAAIIELLNKEINAGLADPALNARLGEFGGTALKGGPSEFERLFVGDTERWTKVMRAANLRPE
jgi:tripartite-type tricarboxylate transporter receptor subunit TctC